MTEPFVLTKGERLNPVWMALSRHLEERIAQLRMQNDGDKDERETAKLRGRIAELKGILALAKDLPVIE